MFCGLGEKRTRFRKKKGKREKPQGGQKWVGWDQRIYKDITNNHEKYFLSYLSRF